MNPDMFRSKRRSIVVPQWEHARLAGVLAYAWGNDRIPGPPIDWDRFTLGVVTHDRGYGPYDTLGIGEVDRSLWYAAQRRGIEARHPDPVVDTVALLHLRRLVAGRDEEEARELVRAADRAIQENLGRTTIPIDDFARADTITELCDWISFRFCFEEATTFAGDVPGPTYGVDISMSCEIDGKGRITLDPWPLNVDDLRGFIVAFESDGYPDRLAPVIVPYMVAQTSVSSDGGEET